MVSVVSGLRRILELGNIAQIASQTLQIVGQYISSQTSQDLALHNSLYERAPSPEMRGVPVTRRRTQSIYNELRCLFCAPRLPRLSMVIMNSISVDCMSALVLTDATAT